MKNNKGITLIALIVTIIIMLILAGVTIYISSGDGLFNQTKKAAFQTEVRQIQEQVENRKTVVIAKNNRRIPASFDISFDDLDLDKSIKNKYNGKLVIVNGELYYEPSLLTEEEIEWVEELGINKKGFFVDVIISSKSEGNQENGIYKCANIFNNVFEEYPDAIIGLTFVAEASTINSGDPNIINYPIVMSDQGLELDNSTYTTTNSYKRTEGIYLIAGKYNMPISQLIREYNYNTLSSNIKQEVDDVMALYPLNIDDNIGETIADAITTGIKFILVNDDEILLVGFENIVDITDTRQVISKEEFSRKFSYTESGDKITITSLKYTEKDMVIPSMIYDENGNFEYIVKIQSGAFNIASELNATQGALLSSEIAGTALLPDYKDSNKTLENIATEAAALLNQKFGITVNVFNKYDASIKDSTSLDDKNQYVGIPMVKILSLAMSGTTVNNSNVEGILASIPDNIVKIDSNKDMLITTSSMGNLIPYPVQNIENLTIFMPYDEACVSDDFINFDSLKNVTIVIPTGSDKNNHCSVSRYAFENQASNTNLKVNIVADISSCDGNNNGIFIYQPLLSRNQVKWYRYDPTSDF